MKLQIAPAKGRGHKDVASAAGWSNTNELYTCSDDQTVQKWDSKGESAEKVCELGTFFTDLSWYPCASKRQQGGIDIFAVSCTDGTFKLFSRSGRFEKSVDSHRGAVLCVRWNYEGTALATAGEDGAVRVWSRSGMLRSTLAQCGSPVYSLAWGPDSDLVLFGSGEDIHVRHLQSRAKDILWRAHKGCVLKVDWSPVNDLVISGGEDCKYKVWDRSGRLLYQSAPLEHSITALAWCPTAQLFAVGSFNHVRLCDRSGWSYSKDTVRTGSLLNFAWTQDGTQLAGVGGNGAVLLGELLGLELELGRIRATLVSSRHIRIYDLLAETHEDLDFRDRVIKMCLGYGHFVVATATQCCIYSSSNWNTPHILDLKDVVHLLLLCDRSFLMLDNFNGIQLYSYDGRPLCAIKFQGLHTEFLNEQLISLASDTVAIVDRSQSKTVRFFDTAQGRAIGEPLNHSLEVLEVALSQAGTMPERKVAILDRNHDLWIAKVMQPRSCTKLASMVDSMAWHDAAPMLATLAEEKLTVWYYPHMVFVDKDLIAGTSSVLRDGDLADDPRLLQFSRNRCMLRRGDGAQITALASPYPQELHALAAAGQWDKALKLCWFIKDPVLWSCLAGMALDAKELGAAEAALAACEQVDKLQYVQRVKALPSPEARAAEMALLAQCPREAEAIFLQAGLLYRAIKMHIKLFNWERALELALKHQTHIDTVLMFRHRHLKSLDKTEFLPQFLKLASEMHVDEQAVLEKIIQEKELEKQRNSLRRYT